MNQAWRELNGQFDVLSLAHSPVNLEPTNDRGEPFTTPGLQKVLRALAMPGQVIAQSYLPTLLDIYKEALVKQKPIDTVTVLYQRYQRWYGFFPPIARQLPGYSDIEQEFRDYHHIEVEGRGLAYDPEMVKPIN